MGLDYPVLCDHGLEVSERYGLAFTLPDDLAALYLSWGINLPEENGVDEWRLPIPASFVIDTAGIVRFRHVDPDYRFRPEPTDYLPLLVRLGGAS